MVMFRSVMLAALCAGCNIAEAIDGDDPPGEDFRIHYTHVEDLDGTSLIEELNFAYEWYVEGSDLSFRGPFESDENGNVELGDESRTTASITANTAGLFYQTWVDAPVGPIEFYTGPALSSGTVTINVEVTHGAVGETVTFPNLHAFMTIEESPQTFSGNFGLASVIDRDGGVTVFASAACGAEYPSVETCYASASDIPLASANETISFDVSTFATRSAREWTSTSTLPDPPIVVAQRKGHLLPDLSDATADDPDNLSGSIGIPDQFSADAFYVLVGRLAVPTLVTRFDAATSEPIELDPLDRVIDSPADEDAVTLDLPNHVLQFKLATVLDQAGTDDFGFGVAILNDSGTMQWTIHFPGSSLSIQGDNATLNLPELPDHPTLPDFDSVTLILFRLDGETTHESMVRFLLDRMNHPLQEYATTQVTEF